MNTKDSEIRTLLEEEIDEKVSDIIFRYHYIVSIMT